MCVTRKVIVMRGSMVLSLPVQLVFPDVIRSKIVDFEFLSEAHRFLKKQEWAKINIFSAKQTLWTSRSFSGCFVNSWSKTLFNVIKNPKQHEHSLNIPLGKFFGLISVKNCRRCWTRAASTEKCWKILFSSKFQLLVASGDTLSYQREYVKA